MEKEKRFNVGDKVTYKLRADCPGGKYYYGGSDQGGCVGTIESYSIYNKDQTCWRIAVTLNNSSSITYTMLESEFIEYDVKQEESIPEYLECIENYATYVIRGTTGFGSGHSLL